MVAYNNLQIYLLASNAIFFPVLSIAAHQS